MHMTSRQSRRNTRVSTSQGVVYKTVMGTNLKSDIFSPLWWNENTRVSLCRISKRFMTAMWNVKCALLNRRLRAWRLLHYEPSNKVLESSNGHLRVTLASRERGTITQTRLVNTQTYTSDRLFIKKTHWQKPTLHLGTFICVCPRDCHYIHSVKASEEFQQGREWCAPSASIPFKLTGNVLWVLKCRSP